MPEKEEVIYKLCEAMGHLSAMQNLYGATVMQSVLDKDVDTCLKAIKLIKTLPGSAKRQLIYDGVLCGNCGRRIHYDSEFCDKCGWRVTV